MRARSARKPKLETGTMRTAIVNACTGAVGARYLHYDCKTKPGAAAGRALAAPEPLEDLCPIADRHTGAAIADTHRTGRVDLD